MQNLTNQNTHSHKPYLPINAHAAARQSHDRHTLGRASWGWIKHTHHHKYIHTHTQTYTHITLTHAHIHEHAYAETKIHANMHIHITTHTHTHTHTHTRIHARLHTHTLTNEHAYTDKNKNPCKHTHISIRTTDNTTNIIKSLFVIRLHPIWHVNLSNQIPSLRYTLPFIGIFRNHF